MSNVNLKPLFTMVDSMVSHSGELEKWETKTERRERLPYFEMSKSHNQQPARQSKKRHSLRSQASGVKEDVKAAMVITMEGTIKLSHTSYNAYLQQPALDQLFERVRSIGSGSFGEVIEAKSRVTPEHTYAIKISTKPVRENDPNKYQEVYSLFRAKDHQNIIKMYNAWEDSGKIFIQTELCQGDLLRAVEQRRFTENETWDVFVDVLLAMDHLHTLGLLHNDIKPENVFLGKHGIYKLGDFGMMCEEKHSAIKIDENGEGDSRYLAREVLQGHSSTASDVFSFGVTLLEIISDLHMPVQGLIWQAIRDERIPNELFDGFSAEIQGFVRSMLREDPEKRPACAQLCSDSFIGTMIERRKDRVTMSVSDGLFKRAHVVFTDSPGPSDSESSAIPAKPKVSPSNLESPTFQSPPVKRVPIRFQEAVRLTPSGPLQNHVHASTWPPRRPSLFPSTTTVPRESRVPNMPVLAEHHHRSSMSSPFSNATAPSTPGPSEKPASSMETPTSNNKIRKPLRPPRIHEDPEVAPVKRDVPHTPFKRQPSYG